MSEFIFNNSSIYTTGPDNKKDQEIYYTMSGMEDYIDENNHPRLKDPSDKNIFAKKILRHNNSIKYMIKLNAGGKLTNPASIYGFEKEKTFLDKVCRSNSKFKEVNNKVFELYLKFLQSKNTSWLYNAEREAE